MLHHNIRLYVAGVVLLLLTCAGCSNTSKNQPSQPEVDSQDNNLITLEKPIVLELLVNPQHKAQATENSTLRANVGELSRTYSEIEKKAATVNTKSKVNTPDPDYNLMMNALDVYKGDWIRYLTIPELSPSDYVVEGLVPIKDDNILMLPSPALSTISDKVTIKFFKLPKDGVLSFIANGRAYSNYPFDDQLSVPTLENPYLLSSNPRFQFNSIFKNAIEPSYKPWLEIQGDAIFHTTYLPMFGRLYRVAPNSAGDGIVGTDVPNGEVTDIKKIYLEHAVSVVTVTFDLPKKENGKYVQDHFISRVATGKFPSITSIVPNNWSGIQRIIADYKLEDTPMGQPFDKVPSYWSFARQKQGWPNQYYVTNVGPGIGDLYFYTPESYPQNASQQNTIIVLLTKFDPATVTVKKEDEEYKYFELPYGEKNPETGFLEVHRNTWYNLHIKLKQTPEGVVPYIVDTWSNQDVDLPW